MAYTALFSLRPKHHKHLLLQEREHASAILLLDDVPPGSP